MNPNVKEITECWCGSKDLQAFSDNYVRCNKCNTLINSPRPNDSFYEVKDDNNDYYSKKYWFEHQTEDFKLPSIIERARTDIYDRCIDWLKIMLSYKLPPGKVLEIGCGNGSFLALLESVGFEAIGTELSSWIVEFVKDTFNATVLKGKIEDLAFENSSYDILVAFDVLEHLINPEKTLLEANRILKNDGLFIIQSPCYSKPFIDYETLLNQADKFISMLIPKEHVYLFNQDSIKLLLSKVGFVEIEILGGLFPYDMIVVASKKPLARNNIEDVQKFLINKQQNKILLALIDLNKKWKECETDRAQRLELIIKADKMLTERDKMLMKKEEILFNTIKELDSLKKSWLYKLMKTVGVYK
jgi:2-polyprenyl-3-methyl-5-hydroxy-6-metoxy-1,4-benzoquinol methylase